jgi:mannose-binding lectin 2
MRGQTVSVMHGDGTKSYDHHADGASTTLSSCHYDIRVEDKAAYAWITYDGKELRTYVSREGEPFQLCLSVLDISLPRGFYFGLSAATGDLVDNHDILSFKVSDPLSSSNRNSISSVRYHMLSLPSDYPDCLFFFHDHFIFYFIRC